MIFELTEESFSIGDEQLLDILPTFFIKLWQELFHVPFGTVGLHAILFHVGQ
jgi:hypothetical protein